MPYSNRIKTLEESYRLVNEQINNLQQSKLVDNDRLKKLTDARAKYFNELRELRRAQYEDSQNIDYGDE
jgi:prefoldin subunit 5